MSTANGDWKEMQKLVLSKMDEHTNKLDHLQSDMSSFKTQIAVLNDREDRELIAARTVAAKWGTVLGVISAAFVSGVIGIWRNP